MKHTEIIANDWNSCSDRYYGRIYSENILERLVTDPTWAFPPEVWAMLHRAMPDLHQKRVLVPSSGDNGAAFAFHLLGAQVTSADIAQRQIDNAKAIADQRHWAMEFVLDDSMKLEHIDTGAFDLVYTSNGVHVWIDDLPAMYRNIRRVLKPGGAYLMFETHPFIRPFDGDAADALRFQVQKPYECIGPFGEVPTYSWRIMDLVNAMLHSGLSIRQMEEFHSQIGSFDCWWYQTLAEAAADENRKFDWTRNPFAALPQWIGFLAQKEAQ